jgi:DNA topoisomerase-1
LTSERAELLTSPAATSRRTDPATGHRIVARSGRFGPYVTELLPDGDTAKPRTSSLLDSMSLDTVTLDDALRLLTLPRTIGELDGETVTVQNGRYGPYVKKGSDSRSLDNEDQLFSLGLAEAKEMFAQPKTRGRGRVAAPPLRELGEDPSSNRPVVLKDGRFGPTSPTARPTPRPQGRRRGDRHPAARGRATRGAPRRRACKPRRRRPVRPGPGRAPAGTRRTGGGARRTGTSSPSRP